MSSDCLGCLERKVPTLGEVCAQCRKLGKKPQVKPAAKAKAGDTYQTLLDQKDLIRKRQALYEALTDEAENAEERKLNTRGIVEMTSSLAQMAKVILAFEKEGLDQGDEISPEQAQEYFAEWFDEQTPEDQRTVIKELQARAKPMVGKVKEARH